MAGHAEKKQAKYAETTIWYYLYAILGVNALYLLWRVMMNWDSMGKWNQIGFLLFAFVSYVTYGGIKSSLELGVDFEWYQDVYLVNLTTQFLVTFSNWGWCLYLVVPGYLGYKVLRMLLDYVFTPTEAELAENDPRAKKRAEKKAKQADRPKMKFSRR
mmetsp:Transcript_12529/g.25480  ORF Transcript_12529/g.25480 Transcript_12529/m.25480 type:complete len:158 (+) Transcript_12529:3-476(+)